MRTIFIALMATLNVTLACAQDMKKEFIDPDNASASTSIVKVRGGTLVFLAGHTASVADRSASLGNFDTQAKNTMDKIKTTMEKSGGSLETSCRCRSTSKISVINRSS